MVFLTFVPLGVLSIIACLPMVRSQATIKTEHDDGPVDWLGGVLLVAPGLCWCCPVRTSMQVRSPTCPPTRCLTICPHFLFLLMLGVFFLVERRMSNPIVDVRHFRDGPFSLSLATNVTYHFSMLATMTLVPILVEEGFGMAPLFCDRRAAAKPDTGTVHADGGGLGVR